MKKLLLILLCLPMIGFGQLTMIPDANFEQALINLGYDTGPPNGSVPTANINTVNYLHLGNQNISDLTGIEDFADLYSFYCNNNQLLTLDLSSNSVLYQLDCSYNQLSTLSLIGNSNLEILACGNNQLSNLDVNANPLLRNLNAPANSLSNINLINNISLTSLGLGNNQLTTLNLNNNISLEHLNIVNNQVSILNLIYNVSLTDIWISNNNIGALDISNSPNLWVIWGDNNQITTLDVSNNTLLTQLWCTHNLLTSLDVRNGNNSSMNVFSTTGNPNLTCINVDNPVYSSANWTSIDPQHTFSMSCPVLGCTDILACNYDSTATVDDGSCVYPTTSTTTITSCDSYTWLDGVTYTTSNNTATFTTTNAAGCDSVITLDLTINQSATSTTTITACDTYTWNGTTYTTSGTYVETITAVQTPQVGDFIEGGVVFWIDPTDNTKGLVCDVNDLANSEWGCFGTNIPGAGGILIGTGAQNTIDIVAANCSPYTSGNTIAANECANLSLNGYTDWFLPSRDELNQMYVNLATINAIAALNSGSAFTTNWYWSSSEYSYNNAWHQYFSNGSLVATHKGLSPNSVRAVRAYTVTIGTCDSTATLNLTILNSTTSTDVQTACDTYTWLDGVTYTASNNTATFTTTNTAGCDSVITLDLTINQSATSTTTITACDTYTWNGTTYTTSGTYVNTITAGQTPQVGNFVEGGVVFWIDPTDNTKGLVCDVNDLANSEWGCFQISVSGADGTAIGTGAQNTIDIVNANCSPYTLGNTIAANVCANSTAQGYSDWFLPSKDELNQICINKAAINATAALNSGSAFATSLYWSSSENASYDAWNQGFNNGIGFYNGHQYTSTKIYPNSIRAVRAYTVTLATCDSTATLNLTITNSTTSTDVQTACDTYTWNGTTYTASNNTATFTTTNAAGCDSVITLDLTINNSTTSYSTVTLCGDYLWNGTLYTSSGIYTFTTTNANGCDSTVTLNLSLSNLILSTTDTCESECWAKVRLVRNGGIAAFSPSSPFGLSITSMDINGIWSSEYLAHDMTWGSSYYWSVLEDSIRINCSSDSLTLWTDSLFLIDTLQVYIDNTLIYELYYNGGISGNHFDFNNYNFQHYGGGSWNNLASFINGGYPIPPLPYYPGHPSWMYGPSAFMSYWNVGNVTNSSGTSGSIDLTVSGGTTPYTYLWDNGSINSDQSGLPNGTYCVTVTDASNPPCTENLCVTIDCDSCPLVLSATDTCRTVLGQFVQSIDLTVSGGSCYTYSWTGPGGPYATEDLTGLVDGTYCVTVTDCYDTSCTETLCITIACDTCPQSVGILNVSTGYDNDNYVVYNPGNNDPNWILVGSPNPNTILNVPANVIAPNSVWHTNNNAGWIAEDFTYSPTTNDSGFYSFRNCFCLSQADSVSVDLLVSADNYAEISLLSDYQTNYQSLNIIGALATGFPTSNFNYQTHFVYNTFLNEGRHCLVADLSNSGWSATGLKIEGSISSNSGFVENFNCCDPCIFGCMDPTASNYDPLATCPCLMCCTIGICGGVTGVNMTDVIHDRATFNWDDMNSSTCNVDQIRIRYREVGTSSYSNKTMGIPVGSGCNTANTYKRVLGLSASTQYEYDFKLWYCGAATVNWHAGGTFTTAVACDNVTNVTATPVNTTKTSFCWTAPSSPYSFVRLQYRENVTGSSFSNIGGFGVFSPALCKDKNGLTPGLQYRVMWRTWCSATGGPYRSPVWDGPVLWTQNSPIRVEGENTAITNLEVYPNPSRDIFNITFTSNEKQDLEIRIINVIGENIFIESKQQFVGEYTKQIMLGQYPKAIYFLEIETDDGVINKELILQ